MKLCSKHECYNDDEVGMLKLDQRTNTKLHGISYASPNISSSNNDSVTHGISADHAVLPSETEVTTHLVIGFELIRYKAVLARQGDNSQAALIDVTGYKPDTATGLGREEATADNGE